MGNCFSSALLFPKNLLLLRRIHRMTAFQWTSIPIILIGLCLTLLSTNLAMIPDAIVALIAGIIISLIGAFCFNHQQK